MTESPIQTGLKHKGKSLDLANEKSRCLASGQAYLVAQMKSLRIPSVLVLPFFDFIFRFYKSSF